MFEGLIEFTESLGSRSYQVGTALVGAQPGFSYQVAEPWVEVVISGPVRQLDELGVEGLSVEVPVSGLQVPRSWH